MKNSKHIALFTALFMLLTVLSPGIGLAANGADSRIVEAAVNPLNKVDLPKLSKKANKAEFENISTHNSPIEVPANKQITKEQMQELKEQLIEPENIENIFLKNMLINYSQLNNGDEIQLYADGDDYTRSKHYAQIAGIGEHCVIAVDKSAVKYNEFSFKGSIAPATQAIIEEFDNNIFDLMAEFGEIIYPFNQRNLKAVIFLTELNSSNADTYQAGFFWGIDLFPNGYIFENELSPIRSNEAALLYIDIGSNHGFARLDIDNSNSFDPTSDREGLIDFCGTIAHEMQHMVNAGIFVYNSEGNNTYHDTWLLEGLGCLAEYMYTGEMEYSQWLWYFADNFKDGIGYTPNDTQWRNIKDDKVLANYGAAATMLIYYQELGGDVRALVKDFNRNKSSQARLISSLGNPQLNTFDKFLSFINTAYPTEIGPYYYWMSKKLIDDGNDGINSATHPLRSFVNKCPPRLQHSTNHKINCHNALYSSQIYLAESVGPNNNTARITLSNPGSGKYYAVVAKDAVNLSNYELWQDSDKLKEVYDLAAGVNEIPVGRNNMYAVLGVSFNANVNATINSVPSNRAYLEFMNPEIATTIDGTSIGELHQGVSGQTINVNARIKEAMINYPVKAEVYNSSNVLQTGFVVANNSNLVKNNDDDNMKIIINVPSSAPTGAYYVKVSGDNMQIINNSNPAKLNFSILSAYNYSCNLEGSANSEIALFKVKQGYTPAATTLTLKNSGTGKLTGLSITKDSSDTKFAAVGALSSTTLEKDQKATFTVAPLGGLTGEAGSSTRYSTTLTIKANELAAPLTYNLVQEVEGPPSYSFTPLGNTVIALPTLPLEESSDWSTDYKAISVVTVTSTGTGKLINIKARMSDHSRAGGGGGGGGTMPPPLHEAPELFVITQDIAGGTISSKNGTYAIPVMLKNDRTILEQLRYFGKMQITADAEDGTPLPMQEITVQQMVLHVNYAINANPSSISKTISTKDLLNDSNVITLTNTGSGKLLNLNITSDAPAAIKVNSNPNPLPDKLIANGAVKLSISSDSALPAGEYKFTINVSADNLPNPLSIPVVYTVSAPTSPGGGGGGGGGGTTYTVTFVANDDTDKVVASKSVSPGQKVTLPDDPKRTGYTFDGWNTKADGSGSSFSSNTTISAALTVYAQWIAVIETKQEIPKTEEKIPLAIPELPFSDLQPDYGWAKEAITSLYSRQIVSGVGPNSFMPAAPIKRGDFTLMLVKAFNLQADPVENFEDVDLNSYYYNAIAIVKALGIAHGSNNQFDPEASISRQDAMVLLVGTLNYLGKGLAVGNDSDLARFADQNEIADYARVAAATLVKAGIISGNGNSLNPLGNTTRAEMAVILNKTLSLYNS